MSWSHGPSHGACWETRERDLEAVGVIAAWSGAD